MEIYAFPKRFIATTAIRHNPNHWFKNNQHEIIMSYLDLWLPRARAFLPFGIAPTYIYRMCGRKPRTIAVNSDVAPTYLCRLPQVLRDVVSCMVTHERDVDAPKPDPYRGTYGVHVPACSCSDQPLTCPIHTKHDGDCVRINDDIIANTQYYLVKNGDLVPYETPQTFMGMQFTYKLHNLQYRSIGSIRDKVSMDWECDRCNHYVRFRSDAFFEYGRPHKIGRPALDGNYYLFGKRIDPGYDTICAREADERAANATTIEFNGCSFAGTRTDFPNGWAQELHIKCVLIDIEIISATASDEIMHYRIDVSLYHRDDCKVQCFNLIVILADEPTFTIAHCLSDDINYDSDVEMDTSTKCIVDQFEWWFETRDILGFFRPYDD